MEIAREVLLDLYVEQRLTYQEIARRLEVKQHQVLWSLGAAGIPLRDKSAASKGRPKSEAHRAKLRANLEKARAAQTDKSRQKAAEKMKGRPPPNKGKPWSEETRAKHSYRQAEEYRRAASERQRGEKAPNWKGGQTNEETRRMQGFEWRLRRAECYERDNWTCRDCGVKCANGVRIAAHHIIPRRHGGSDDLDNLLTLCGSCHSRRESLYRAAFIA